MERVDLYMLMEMCTLGTGKTTKLMDMDFTFIRMDHSMKENGKTTSNMGMERNTGLTALPLRVITLKERNKARVTFNGLMAVNTKENSTTTTSVEQVSIDGLMVGCLRAPGLKTKCMGLGCLHGLMGEYMKENMYMTKKKDKACSSGLMAGSTMEGGRMESNME